MTAAARILDRGYRRYEGERTGVGGSMRSLVKYTTQRVLGIHRKFRYKVMPALTIVMSYVPTMVFVGIVVLTNRLEQQTQGTGLPAGAPRAVANQLIADYPGSYGFIVAAIVLFAAFVAPEVLCTDRRSGMLGLYLASPLNRWSYLGAKAMAVIMMLSTVTLGPPVLLLIGYSTQGYGPSSAADWASTIARILVTGLGLGLFHTMVSCAISSITSRRAAASAAFIVLLIGSSVLSSILIMGAQGPSWLAAFDLLNLPLQFAFKVFGQVHLTYLPEPETPASVVYIGFAAWIGLSALVIWDRYRRIEVGR